MELRWRRTENTPRFVLLLAAMFLEILLSPLMLSSPAGVVGSRIVTGLLLVAALSAVGARPRPGELDAGVAAIEQAAIQASCETRLLVGQQAAAFTAAALPLCRRV